MSLITHRVVPFIKVNGRYVRDHKTKPVEVRSMVKGNSLTKFARTTGRIGYHKWS